MKKMNRPVVVALVAGVVLGALGGAGLVAQHYNRLFAGWYLMGVTEQALIAREIRTGTGDQLAERIAASLPDYALVVEAEFGQSELRLPALWSIRDYYLATDTPTPDEISGLLESLPPRTVARHNATRPDPRGQLEDAL